MMNDEETSSREQRGLDRILALSDGVFAFALTLLVLSLTAPALVGVSSVASSDQSVLNMKLLSDLAGEAGAFFAYAISFFVISIWWVAHHRLFRYINKYDAPLMWRNLFFLLFITIIPFLTELLNQDGGIQIAVVIYDLSQALGGLALTAVWNHAANKSLLISKSLTVEQIRNIRLRNIVPSITFLIAIGVVFLIPTGYGVSPGAANTVLFAMFPMMRVVSRKKKASE